MLYTETVSKELLDLLKILMSISPFKELRLVGGTSLALQIGHRDSVDLDLFGNLSVDKIELDEILNQFDKVKSLGGSKSINVFFINGIKVDIVNYPYPWLEGSLIEDSIVLAGKRDIAAMKISAITQRGSKKDFIDLYFLLKDFSLKDILSFYKIKFQDANLWMAIRSLTYFDDANLQPMPKMFIEISWNEIKRHINEEVIKYQESFEV